MASPVEREVQVPADQRTLVWRHNHGWTKCKTCSFCCRRFHLDHQGQWAYGSYYDSPHRWYCGVQCNNHLSGVYLQSLLTPKRR